MSEALSISTLPTADSRRVAVTRLTLSNFRCYGRVRVETNGGSVILVGPNGAGKTNLLEALSFLVPGRGLRGARLAEADRRGGTGPWAVSARIDFGDRQMDLGTGRDPAGDAANGRDRRIVRIDGETRGQAALSNALQVLWVAPDMDRLFVDGASARRRFLDRLVYGFDAAHSGRISAYEHALRERSRLLRDGVRDPAWLAALEGAMAEHGTAIAAARRDAIDRLDAAASLGVGPFPRASLSLEGAVEGWLAEMPALAAEDGFKSALTESRARDAETGGAAVGPHRTDLTATHLAKDMPASQCSTGEQKALLMAIVLAHARVLSAAAGRPPVMLFDEVAAHLDEERRSALFDEIVALDAQAWMTGTDAALFQPLDGHARLFRVENAALRPSSLT